MLSGTVSSKYVIEKAADVAGGYVEKKENVVNLLKQQEGVASNQVMLRVRFAEVSRNALQELGASLFAQRQQERLVRPHHDAAVRRARVGTQDGKLVFSDFLNLFLFDTKEGLGGVVKALQNKGLFQSLAEPNLIATNGKEASFLAGGEFPYPVVQAGADSNAVTIMFKEFGVRLSFTPTVLGGDLINLKIRPEVSSLDFNNAVTIEGFRIPALTTRRAETEVELRDGQTFAIAGLMNNTLTSSMRRSPASATSRSSGYCSGARRTRRTRPSWSSWSRRRSSAATRRACRKACRLSSSRTWARRRSRCRTRAVHRLAALPADRSRRAARQHRRRRRSAPAKPQSHPWPGRRCHWLAAVAGCRWPGSSQLRPVVTSVGEYRSPQRSDRTARDRPIQTRRRRSAARDERAGPEHAGPSRRPTCRFRHAGRSAPAQSGPVPMPTSAAQGQSSFPSVRRLQS